ncbi:MAG: YicC family protein [Candidatus Aminicenantes bacterium RBG_13_59_9]|nr:MAG: YicC family protein [Candidatus Aminicenantes bacterium RBG_13_59_9]
MRSMTGYGEKRFSSPGLRAKISIKSLNHRFFDWNYKGTPLGEVENKLRALAQRKLLRGRIEAAVDLDFLDPSNWEISINEALFEKVLATLERASRRMGKAVSLSVDNIFRIPQVVEIRRRALNAEMKSFLERSFDETLDEVVKERRREGRETARQIRRHLGSIRRSLRSIVKLARTQPLFIREKLAQRIKDLDSDQLPGGEKVEGEVAYLAQKADIAEEIVRLKSHVGAFEQWVREGQEEPVGRMLDFLSQEIAREANTINSKSQNIAITKESLAIKGEVESIRQHIQNIE